ncbi:MAG: DUF5700 domain-containing putative Zn-dependent protease [Bacillota bacterium]
MCLDFSGVDLFWRIADDLSRGVEPGEKAWRSIFDTPAYRALTASEFSEDFFRECWHLAFHPDSRREDPPSSRLRFVRHYRRVLQRKRELLPFLDRLRHSPDLHDSAAKMALSHLPPGDYSAPRVAFAVFDLDGRGYRPIVVDPLCAMTRGDQLLPFLAHEFHHHYVCQLTGVRLGTAQDNRTDLQWVVDQIHLEGLANMVNMDGPFKEGTCPECFAREVRRAPEFLLFMDGQLRSLGDCPGEASSAGREIRARLPSSGHPVGYYMTALIRDHLGKEQLLQNSGNALQFFRTFSRAEEAADLCRTLSPEALDILEHVVSGTAATDGPGPITS